MKNLTRRGRLVVNIAFPLAVIALMSLMGAIEGGWK